MQKASTTFIYRGLPLAQDTSQEIINLSIFSVLNDAVLCPTDIFINVFKFLSTHKEGSTLASVHKALCWLTRNSNTGFWNFYVPEIISQGIKCSKSYFTILVDSHDGMHKKVLKSYMN